jgi:hypothetical protein
LEEYLRLRTLAVACSSESEQPVKKAQGGNLQVRESKSKRRRRNKGMCLEDRPVWEPNAAGIDVGAREMFVAVGGGKLLWRGARRVKNRAGHLFRLAAFSLHHSLTPLGNYLRRMKAKLGPKAATMATAHKIATIFYNIIKNQVEYDETIWEARDAHSEKRLEAKLKRQAKRLGYQLVPIESNAA